ncbi:MAG: PQQ-binding-like beta-propeller repeat protein [Pseudomonadota bacterium]|nr:PQQ-binding-like beta-propeller repeat protein [Pseudomonadota bacterium]
MTKVIINYFFFFLATAVISACGAGKFLGFEEKKIPLKGKRVSVLKDIEGDIKNDFSTSKVQLSKLESTDDWKQSYNTASHISINFLYNRGFNNFSKVTSGVGSGKDKDFLSQPIISKNRLIFLDANSNLYVYDILKKKYKWKKSLVVAKDKGHNLGGGLAADDKFIFVSSPYAEVMCIEIDTGKMLWKKQTITPVRAMPTLLEKKVIFLTLDNRTLLLNKSNGEIIWEHQGIQNSTSIIGQPKIATAGNLVIIPYSNGEVFALNLTNGAEIWRQSTIKLEQSEASNSFSDIDASPIILKNLIIVACTNGKLFAFNKKNGSKVWEQYVNTSQTPAVNGNSIYLVHNNKEVINLDLNNGKIRWIVEIEKYLKNERKNIWFAPVLINSQLVVVGGGKNMLIFNPYNGELEKKYTLPGVPASPPIIVKQDIFLMFKNASIFSIK